jgi:hypothetical protein
LIVVLVCSVDLNGGYAQVPRGLLVVVRACRTRQTREESNCIV